jgi:hypothetical protein
VVSNLISDESGEVSFIVEMEGKYIIGLIHGGQLIVIKELEVSREPSILDALSDLAVYLTGDPVGWTILALIIILTIAGITYYRYKRRTQSNNTEDLHNEDDQESEEIND